MALYLGGDRVDINLNGILYRLNLLFDEDSIAMDKSAATVVVGSTVEITETDTGKTHNGNTVSCTVTVTDVTG